jgi:hypothetical protein
VYIRVHVLYYIVLVSYGTNITSIINDSLQIESTHILKVTKSDWEIDKIPICTGNERKDIKMW